MVALTEIYKGKLTYTLSLIALVWGVIGWVFGWLEQEEALKVIWASLTVFGIRRALPSSK